jgi:hypothetical protein
LNEIQVCSADEIANFTSNTACEANACYNAAKSCGMSKQMPDKACALAFDQSSKNAADEIALKKCKCETEQIFKSW